jgi:hypothetical protein
MTSIADPRRKSVPLAVMLSVFMPGLGQVYAGFVSRGILIALVFVSFIGTLVAGPPHAVIPMLAIGLAFVYFFGLIDAGQCANYINMALEGVADVRVPKPGPRSVGGSLVGGSLLVLLGTLALLSIHADFSMDWLADWWPLGLVALGVYVFYQGWKGRQAA